MYPILRTLCISIHAYLSNMDLSNLSNNFQNQKKVSFTKFSVDPGKRIRKERGGGEAGRKRDAYNGVNTNSFPFDIRAREKSVRFIKFRENVGTPTNSPARSLWHPSIVFLGTPINIYEHGRATRSRLEAEPAFPFAFRVMPITFDMKFFMIDVISKL